MTPPLKPRTVATQLAASTTLLDNLTRRIPAGIHNAQHAARNPDVDDKPKAETTGKRKGWINDPTGETATNVLLSEDDYLDLLDAHLETLRLALAHLTRFADRWAPIDSERRLCGDYSPSDIRQHPAFDAACRRIAESDTTPDGKLHWRSNGLCTGCRRRLARHDSDHDAA